MTVALKVHEWHCATEIVAIEPLTRWLAPRVDAAIYREQQTFSGITTPASTPLAVECQGRMCGESRWLLLAGLIEANQDAYSHHTTPS